MPAHLIVFAKAPLPGRVKTRLIPTLGASAAATLAARMLEHTLAQAALAGLSVELCASPADHPLLARAAERVGAKLSAQGEGDLGERMAGAMRRALGEHARVLLIGTDCPALDAAALRAAAAELDMALDAYFRPTRDGGYILIGLTRFHPRLFEDMPWSTGAVMSVTRSRLRRLGWQWGEGAPLSDVDEPHDLALLPVAWRSVPGAGELLQ